MHLPSPVSMSQWSLCREDNLNQIRHTIGTETMGVRFDMYAPLFRHVPAAPTIVSHEHASKMDAVPRRTTAFRIPQLQFEHRHATPTNG